MGGIFVRCIAYADDIILISALLWDLQYMLNIICVMKSVMMLYLTHFYLKLAVYMVKLLLVDRLQNGSPYAIGPLSCLSVCLSCLSVCDVGVLWPNGWTDQDET